jgi:uncharacterized protein (UPF0548 family)
VNFLRVDTEIILYGNLTKHYHRTKEKVAQETHADYKIMLVANPFSKKEM